eukprot:PhF_6_TR12879/c0_g1_i1/m.20253
MASIDSSGAVFGIIFLVMLAMVLTATLLANIKKHLDPNFAPNIYGPVTLWGSSKQQQETTNKKNDTSSPARDGSGASAKKPTTHGVMTNNDATIDMSPQRGPTEKPYVVASAGYALPEASPAKEYSLSQMYSAQPNLSAGVLHNIGDYVVDTNPSGKYYVQQHHTSPPSSYYDERTPPPRAPSGPRRSGPWAPSSNGVDVNSTSSSGVHSVGGGGGFRIPIASNTSPQHNEVRTALSPSLDRRSDRNVSTTDA